MTGVKQRTGVYLGLGRRALCAKVPSFCLPALHKSRYSKCAQRFTTTTLTDGAEERF